MDEAQVRRLMLEDIKRSGLAEKDAKILSFGTQPHALKPAVTGYTIPYFDVLGNKTKFYRVRYLESTLTGFNAMTGAKSQRYSQPPGTVNEVYMPPYIDWDEYLNGNDALIITEGEKKSAVATKCGLPTLGLGGVWCFMSKANNISLLPIFEKMNLANRNVYICFDSDAASNPNILAAEAVLAKRLLEHGAVVMVARIHSTNGKVGMDDYIKLHGKEAFENNVLSTAYEFEESEALHDMNQKLVYLRAIGIIYDYEHSMRIAPGAFLQHSHVNEWIDTQVAGPRGTVRTVRKSAAKMWNEWEFRAELKGITYDPGAAPITENQELNMWKGWGVKDAVLGDVAPWAQLLDIMFERAKPTERKWFEQWCAYPIQNPGYKMSTAAVFWGVTQGTGKSTVGYTLMRMYGDNALEVKDANLQDVRFEWAENKQFVMGDDITGQNNRKLANMFKTMITQKTISVNPKFIHPYHIPDRINYYFTSNDPNAFYLDDGDRRFFIHEVRSDKLSPEFSKEYMKWMNSEIGMQNLFYYFLHLDLKGFDPQADALKTEAKQEMTYISKSELGVWVAELKDNPDSVLKTLKCDLYTSTELHALYDSTGDKKTSANALARELKRSGFIYLTQPGGDAIRAADLRVRLFAIRNADRWRSASVKDIAAHYEAAHSAPKAKKF